jgi:hypothetical protein
MVKQEDISIRFAYVRYPCLGLFLPLDIDSLISLRSRLTSNSIGSAIPDDLP